MGTQTDNFADFKKTLPHMSKDLKRNYNTVLNDVFKNLEIMSEHQNEGGSHIYPPLNLVEREEDFQIEIDLPGMNREEIVINLQNNCLTISGLRVAEEENNGINYHIVECKGGRFMRWVNLPLDVDPEGISADYCDGILTITVKKAKEAIDRNRRIKINSKH
jgi:HSP20 family protein